MADVDQRSGHPEPPTGRTGRRKSPPAKRARAASTGDRPSPLAQLVGTIFGEELPVALEFYDGGRIGPPDPPATIGVRSPDALRRIVTAPGELGFARAYVAGDIDVVGDIYAVLGLRDRLPSPRLTPRQWLAAARIVGARAFTPLPVPREEARQRGRLHSLRRDAQSISHHYDVSNDFYERVLGPAMTYSCALFGDAGTTLEQAQWAKLELVCGKLALRAGMRLLDVGCGWGSMVAHAARHHGVQAVGVTLSVEQAEWARNRIAREGLADRVEIRVQDYRDLTDGPFDAISSIGMSEHVGGRELPEYFDRLRRLLAPQGRLLNHAITRPPGAASAVGSRTFIDRYVFPDAALVELGELTTALQSCGLEARHSEGLREHYARTLRAWVQNLEDDWDACTAEAGLARARIWRLYMAGSALGFEDARIGIAQVLATRPGARFPARPDWTAAPAAPAEHVVGTDRRRAPGAVP